MNEGEFSVWIFFIDGTHFSEWRGLDAGSALAQAAELSKRPAIAAGIFVERIIVTDSGDCTVFEWRPAQSVTWPPSPSLN
jgi:hypothetical protein